MILNEDYFKDLEITDDDVIEDDINDVEEPKHELTLDEFHKLPEQYEHCIEFQINHNWKTTDLSTTSIQTSLLPKLFKRLDAIFEFYGIEHFEYTLSLYTGFNMKYCDTIIKYGNYQLFCEDHSKNYFFIKDDYMYLYISVFVNYPKFNYKRAFRFVYAMLNIFRLDKHITHMHFEPTSEHHISAGLIFDYNDEEITFKDYDSKPTYKLILSDKKLPERGKEKFYNRVDCYFDYCRYGINYDTYERDVPLKPIKI